jgi:hypothetical protein
LPGVERSEGDFNARLYMNRLLRFCRKCYHLEWILYRKGRNLRYV